MRLPEIFRLINGGRIAPDAELVLDLSRLDAYLAPSGCPTVVQTKGFFDLIRYFVLLCAVLASMSGVWAEPLGRPEDRLISLSTRVFDLHQRSPIQDLQIEDGFVSLTDIDWIKDLTWSDPLLNRTVIHIKDRSTLPPGWVPGYLPDDRSRFHPDPTLPPIFDLEGYEVGWLGANEIPGQVRGDLLIIPRHDPNKFYAFCAFDRADPKPIFCSVDFRYGPDRLLYVKTRIYGVTSPLNDFAEIAAKVEAQVRCLDVTEAVRADEANKAAPIVKHEDLVAGGRCRVFPTS